MAEEMQVKRYRLTLDFETWVNDEILSGCLPSDMA
jgi:hypothetical protein